MTVSIAGCKSNTEEGSLPKLAGNCMVYSFMEGVSTSSNNNDVYLIKGTVSDKVEYGINISLVEDLKGNFPKDVNKFTVWGDGHTFIELNRLDDLMLYKKQDVLIMLLTPTRDLSEMAPKGYKWLEKPEDYSTLTCTCSALKLSGDNVSGYILANEGSYGIQTMKFDDFQKKITEILIIKTD